MLNIRFKWVVISSWKMVLNKIPRANRMIAEKEKYTVEERFDMACSIMSYLKKRAKTTTHVYGKENIPKDSNFLLIPNHQGKYDALGILLSVGQPCSVLWSKVQAKRLVGRQVCGLVDAVVIDLEDNESVVNSIKEIVKRAKNNESFIIFPEGGYEDNKNELQEFKTGCFACCLRSKVPIVPVVLYDSYKSMNSNTFEKVTTQVHYLPPVYYEEYGSMKKQEIADLVKGRIKKRLDDIAAGKITEEYETI